ncbi:MAG: pirin family protein [Alphaproteobacteria bacterium]|nr:pirin family protein [Alphaproteobacteria bacterium]
MSTAVEHRRVVRRFSGMPTQDGAGVKLMRLVGTPELPDLDPMLMLDTFRSDNPNDYVAGFPEHPHRGFETVSYMIKGSIAHLDNHGGKGIVTDGGVQWMTAGRGVAHSEMPAQTNGQLFGFQLWLNLPAKEKMRDPWYADIPASDIPAIDLGNGNSAKLIAGEWNGFKGPGPDRAIAPFIADVSVAANGGVDVPVPVGHNAFLYVFEGGAKVGTEAIRKGQLAVLSLADRLRVAATGESARFLIVAGKPLREPIAKYGPFVMNTADEIRKAISDYRSGQF